MRPLTGTPRNLLDLVRSRNRTCHQSVIFRSFVVTRARPLVPTHASPYLNTARRPTTTRLPASILYHFRPSRYLMSLWCPLFLFVAYHMHSCTQLSSPTASQSKYESPTLCAIEILLTCSNSSNLYHTNSAIYLARIALHTASSRLLLDCST